MALDERAGGAGSILLHAYYSFRDMRAAEAAAAMTFYAVFSLFPLLALLVIVGSLIVPTQDIRQVLGQYLTPVFPVSHAFIDEVIARFVRARAASGVIGAVTLLWSASGVFVVLARHITAAWEHARMRNFLQGRLVAISTVGMLVVLLIAAILTSVLISFVTTRIPVLFPNINAIQPPAPLIGIAIRLAPLLLAYMVFFVAYYRLPTVPVLLSEAAWGALAVTLAWGATSSLFSWYINSRAATFNTIFGPLAALAVLMLWMYINSILIIFGAHISAAVGRRNMSRTQAKIKMPTAID